MTIGNSVTSIGEGAFSGCTNLIQKENGVSYVDKWVIDCDTSVSEVILRNGTVGIGDKAFDNRTGLTSVTIPDSLTSIGSAAFLGCSGLASVYYTGDIAGWCGISFWDVLANPLYDAGKLYIDGQLVTDLVIPDSVTAIKKYAFYNCTGLTSVTIGNSVESIGRYAFDGCTGLTEVYYTGDIAGWCGISFGDEYANPLYYAGNLYIDGQSVTDLVIPDSVTEIKGYAFYGCTGLTSVTIGNSVTSIREDAFYNCTGLTSVVFEDTEGWQVSQYSNFSRYTSLSSADLADASTAATYLKSTYRNYYWRKV